MQYEIRNRWTGEAQFSAEIDATDGAPRGLKIGLAIKWALKNRANLRGADLSDADLRGANLRGADLRGANLRGANLSDADLRGANLRDADLRDADLRRANLRGADLSDADLRGANLRDADLRDADLRDADLRDADLRGANLRGANLRGANLRRANLRGADLSGADLSDADLRGANLRGANLSDADLRGANLRGANLSDADLRGADLSDADWIPVIPNIHPTVYEAASAGGALDMGSWHSNGFCGTTHCRAGWVTHLAGEAGRVMDGIMGTAAAAAMIYAKSDPKMERVPNFHATDEAALADMKRLADAEAAP